MNNFLESRPQSLCLMCGKCCRVVTTFIPYDKLLVLAEKGEDGAREFLSIFEPYPSVDDAKKVNPEVVDNILRMLKFDDRTVDDVTFYKCKYISDDNLCGKYQERLELCKRFPSSPWAVVPPGCGFEGWLAEAREEIKQRIREHKKSLIEYETMIKTEDNPEVIEKIKKIITKTKDIIDCYAKYGSDEW